MTSHATWDNVRSRLKQRCVFQRWNLQRQTTSNQHCVFQSWYEQRWTTSKQPCHFQRRVLQCWASRSNVMKITTSKKIIKSFNYYFIIFLTVLLMLRWICWRINAKPPDFLKNHEKYCIARVSFKPFHFAKYQWVFNFTRGRIQAHYD